MKSETIGKLAEALAKAQGMMEAAKKDSTNPFFKSTYADLASVIDAIKEPLAKNNLSYTQYLEESVDTQYVVTELLHSSGEWIKGSMRLVIGGKSDMQALGAATTYARRFSLSAIVGIAQDDDDGNSSQKPPADPTHPSTVKPKIIAPALTTHAEIPSPIKTATVMSPTEAMRKTKLDRLKTIIQDKNIAATTCTKYIQDNYSPALSTKDLDVEQIADMIEWAETINSDWSNFIGGPK